MSAGSLETFLCIGNMWPLQGGVALGRITHRRAMISRGVGSLGNDPGQPGPPPPNEELARGCSSPGSWARAFTPTQSHGHRHCIQGFPRWTPLPHPKHCVDDTLRGATAPHIHPHSGPEAGAISEPTALTWGQPRSRVLTKTPGATGEEMEGGSQQRSVSSPPSPGAPVPKG